MGLQGGTPGQADFLVQGDFNVACSMCGRKRKARTMERNWQGQYRCPWHNEPRQPQDFARGVKDDMSVPYVQNPAPLFVTFTPQLPVSITPSTVQMIPEQLAIVTQSGQRILTFGGAGYLATQPVNYQAIVTAQFPAWATLESIVWSWKSGGIGISIGSPNTLQTTVAAKAAGTDGILLCTVTSTLGAVGTATVRVFS
jgi:hypothetical protein